MRTLAWIAFAIGAAALSGWILDIEVLKRVHPSLVTMKANTAICIMLAALSLLLQAAVPASGVRRLAARGTSVAVAVAGAATLVEHLARVDLGIDHLLFFESQRAAGQSFPGRMGVAACLNFLFLGAALLLLDTRIAGRYWSAPFTVASATTVFLVFLYYFYGVEELQRISRYATIALHTVVAFLCLSFGIFLSRPDRPLAAALLGDGLGSVLARRLLPAAIFVPIVVGWLRVAGEREGLYGTGFGTSMFAALVIIIFTAQVWFTAREINRVDAARKSAEEELRRHAESLEVIVAERTAELRDHIGHLETFSYSITHDMRAPLRAMNGFAQLLQAEASAKLGESENEYLNRIQNAAKRMDRLIEDVLQYSKLSRSELPLEPLNPLRLALDLLEQYPDLAQNRACVRVELPRENVEVMANTAALTQVLSNLLSNALKFVPAGVTPEVTVTCEAIDGVIRITVSDNGIGIAPEQHERVFGVFARLHGKAYAGTGIGLSIVRKGVERMGGTLGLTSAPGQGSTFWFELPRAQAPRGEALEAAQRQDQQTVVS